MPINTVDGRVRIDLARATYDYDRNLLTAVWRLTVAGVRQHTEVVTELVVADLLAALPTECGAMYAWIVAQAVARGDIPAGEVSA